MLIQSLLFTAATSVWAEPLETPAPKAESEEEPKAETEAKEEEAPPPAPVVEKWIGTLAVFGSRKVPLLGKVEFRTDTHVLATATLEGPVWVVAQSTCRVNFKKVAGAKITLDETAPSKMPMAHFTWLPGEDVWMAGPWGSGWDEADHDQDGNPGITMHIAAPFCGGELYVASKASQTARGEPGKGRVVEGKLDIHVEQNILGARGPCLNLMARDTKEWMHGQFAFVKVEDDATCASVKAERFPDPLEEED
jgi:hypothetical protein